MLKQPSAGGDDGSGFTPLVVELAPDAKEEAVVWLTRKISDSEQSGGVLGRGVD